ncbi:MAG: hypothetical protein WCV72_02920 [Patescibacteria group bacterium]
MREQESGRIGLFYLQFISRLRRLIEPFVTPEDEAALAAAKAVELENPNTGMSPEKWESAFGFFDPQAVAELCALGGRSVPRKPEDWKKLAKSAKQAQLELRGLKVVK